MNRFAAMIIALAVFIPVVRAQDGKPSMIADAKQAYGNTKNKVMRAAEKMPEEHYSFQPTKEVRNFGAWVGHLADSQLRTCSLVAGAPKNPGGPKTSKAELVAALKESFDSCDQAFNGITDANATDAIQGPRGTRTRLMTLAGAVAHSEEGYGSMAVYMRLKGLVPPSSER